MEKELRNPDDISRSTLAITPLIVILGSKSDWENFVKASVMHKILSEIGVNYIVVAISAHRNPEKLKDFCERAANAHPTVIFIGIAGGAAALPGSIAAIFKGERLVIGVALPSKTFPDARDASLAITQTPGDIPVNFAGIGENGLEKSARIAAQIIAQGHMGTRQKLKDFLIKHAHDKGPEFLYISGGSTPVI